MAKSQESKSVAPMLADEWVAEWMEEHLPELRQDAWGQRLLYQSLVASFVTGLIAHVAGKST